MKTLAAFSIALAFVGAAFAQKNPGTDYPLTEDSKPHDGVPKGVELGRGPAQCLHERLGGGDAVAELVGGSRGTRPDLAEPGSKRRETLPKLIQTVARKRHVGDRSSIADGPRDNRVALRIDLAVRVADGQARAVHQGMEARAAGAGQTEARMGL